MLIGVNYYLFVEAQFVIATPNWGEVWLFPDPEFIPKSVKGKTSMLPIKVSSLGHVVGKSEKDFLLCPVRALRYYLTRTQDTKIHKGRVKLFLPFNEHSVNELSAPGLANIFKGAIKQAYISANTDLCQEFKINIHQASLLSLSLGRAFNVPLEVLYKLDIGTIILLLQIFILDPCLFL